MTKIEAAAQKIWDYMQVGHTLEKADAIIMFGSDDSEVAKYTASLYLAGWAPLIIFSGAHGESNKHWIETEADKYAAVAIGVGVPKENILIENKSTNTVENILFTKTLLTEKNINVAKVIITQKPYMERRVLATVQKHWPEVEAIVASPDVSFTNYVVPHLTREEIIGSMVGDLERLKLYADKGDLVPQDIPADVWEARNTVRSAGIMRRYVEC